MELKSIRLDRYYSESSYASRFDKDTVVIVIPKMLLKTDCRNKKI